MKVPNILRRLAEDRGGAAIIEMAAALPVLVTMFCGIVEYGTLFSLHHAVQQSANEGARAALAGLSQPERFDIAEKVSRTMLGSSLAAKARDIQTSTADDGQLLTVTVTYDASRHPLLDLPMVPRPYTSIERRASVRLTGL